MTKARRRRPKAGSWLPAIPAAELVELDETTRRLNASLMLQGYSLARSVRPYLTKRLSITLRFVWRKRDAEASVTVTHVIHVPLRTLGSPAS